MTPHIEVLGVKAALLLVQLAFSATMVLLLAGIANLLLRRGSAALRHRVWALTMVAILLMPALLPLLPDSLARLPLPGFMMSELALMADGRSEPVLDEPTATNIETPLASKPTLSAEWSRGDRSEVVDSRRSGKMDHRVASRNLNGPHITNRSVHPVDQGVTSAAVPSDAVVTGDAAEPAPQALSRADTPAMSLLPTVTWIWFLGTVISLIGFFRSLAISRRVRCGAVDVSDTDLLAICNALCERMHVRKPIRIAIGSKSLVPFTTGRNNPLVILPRQCAKWSKDRWRIVLAHEIAHVRRRDVLWQATARLACSIVWFHPLVWLAAWRMRIERETACDDAVLLVGERPSRYATHLVDVASVLAHARAPVPAAVAMAVRCSVERRVRSILDPSKRRGPVGRRTGVTLAFTVLAVLVGAGLLAPAAGVASEDNSLKKETTTTPDSDTVSSETQTKSSETATNLTEQKLAAETEMMIHKNGSVTITVDGEKHLIPPRQVRTRMAELLAGKSTMVFRMEKWEDFERVATERLPMLYEIGIRSITIKAMVNGKEETRTLELSPPSVQQQAVDHDPAVRKAAFDKIETMLKNGTRSDRVNAMDALRAAQNVRFDRSQFLSLVRKSLHATEKSELGRALGVIALVGGDETDVPKVLEYVCHEDQMIRARLCSTLYGLDPSGEHAGIAPAIETLLSDPRSVVRTSTFKSLWGRPSTAAIEKRLIEMSRGPSKGGSSESDNTIYYALSTRPLIRKPVAERLIELIYPKSMHSYRSVWGLTHQATDEARPIVVETLIEVIDTETDGQTRGRAIFGLGIHGGDKAIEKLEAIATNANESKKTREDAAKALRRQGRSAPATEAGTAASLKPQPTPHKKSKKLWEQILQPQDVELRKTALTGVKQMLTDETQAAEALEALVQAREAQFDRAPLVPLVRPHLTSDDDNARAHAVTLMPTLGEGAITIAQVAAYADDDSPIVRRIIGGALLHMDPHAKNSMTGKMIEKLLDDPDSEVVRGTIHVVWGRPTTPAAEEALLDLSFDAELGYDAIYYALTTRPLIRTPVAQRLLELVSVSKQHRGRAIWGLTRNQTTDDARAIVVDALIDVVDKEADGYDRHNAIYGLGYHGSQKALERLRKLASDPDESAVTKEQADALIRQLEDRTAPNA